ncbi:MAG: hypothetical protein KGR26_15795 [Cyanobacteria bacterium REEB65]|nr:hypothetical protein [Cyanobacteria bacterium REEB65]
MGKDKKRKDTALMGSMATTGGGTAYASQKLKTKDKIAIDFDGTLTAYDNHEEVPPPPPLEGAREFLEKLQDAGKHVIVFTHRPVDQVVEWLRDNGMLGLVPGGVTNIKPEAGAYLDDRAVRFEGDYKQAFKALTRKKRLRAWWKDAAGVLGL